MKDITSTITKPLAILGENRRHGFRCQRNARRERKHTQEELVKALIAREAMALQEAEVA